MSIQTTRHQVCCRDNFDLQFNKWEHAARFSEVSPTPPPQSEICPGFFFSQWSALFDWSQRSQCYFLSGTFEQNRQWRTCCWKSPPEKVLFAIYSQMNSSYIDLMALAHIFLQCLQQCLGFIVCSYSQEFLNPKIITSYASTGTKQKASAQSLKKSTDLRHMEHYPMDLICRHFQHFLRKKSV